MFRVNRHYCLSVLALMSSLLTGCASYGQYVWFAQLPASESLTPVDDYTLKVGDTINVRVYEQADLSASGKIRSDGRVSLPFAGEVVAAGKKPLQLAAEIEARLKVFIVSPRVSVSLDAAAPILVTMLGEVGSKGNLTLEPPVTLLQALAQAGGLSDFADDTGIFVVRRSPQFRRIRFNYDDLLTNKGGAGGFQLRSGDVVVVE